MLSFITTHNPYLHWTHSFTPSIILPHNIKTKPQQKYTKSALFGISFAFREMKKGHKSAYSWCLWCEQGEGGGELETKIMKFMEKSDKPTIFPTKRDLVKAGRWDLVEAIQRRGGWYSLGWDEEDVQGGVMDSDIEEFQRRLVRCQETASLREEGDDNIHGEFNASLSVADSEESYSVQPASLDTSVERGVNKDAGIEGILSRLEKQRNSDFGINLGRIEHEILPARRDNGYYGFDTPKDVARINFGENIEVVPNNHQKNRLNMSGDQISSSTKPYSWKTWSYQRTGFQHTEFEAAEISFSKVQVEGPNEASYDKKTVTTQESAEALDGTKEIDHHQIRTRLQHLELELNTALSSLRSKKEQSISEEAIGSPREFEKLSDAWEFQENEFISAQERLRSIRAKLAVLEGKMALAIIEAQKVVEEKQKRIDGARKALQLLRTTCIVWPNSASDVFLVGSFDGWTTQRKMEKSRNGVFSIYLKLYPGRYEIKFIVDGIWKIDPLRPIVDNNGHKNNILIVT